MKLTVKSFVNWNISLVILMSLMFSACNLPFGNSVETAVDTLLATIELPPTPTQPQQPDPTTTPRCTDPAGCP